MRGISIGFLTYNCLFYNKLSISKIRELTRIVPYEILVIDNGSNDGSAEWLRAQEDVTLIETKGNTLRHGQGLDRLVKKANYDIFCALCSDAFPVSVEWLTPAFYLDKETVLSGVTRGKGKNDYVCPSYLFGWTEWLKERSFVDNWPRWDTGQKLTMDAIKEGKKVKIFSKSLIKVSDTIRQKPNNYNGWVWHTWFTGRAKTVPKVVPIECDSQYHGDIETYLRERFNLDY